jgi:hypothetical protein
VGNDQVGEGNMKILASDPQSKVEYELNFLKPMVSTASTSLSFQPEGDGVAVTWAMEGDNDFMGKAFSLVMDMDKMIGKDFEEGLNNLKTLAEADQVKLNEEKAAAEAAAAAVAAEAAAAQAATGTDAAGAVPAEGAPATAPVAH